MKTKLPKIRSNFLEPLSSTQEKRIERWMVERALDLDFRSEIGEEAPVADQGGGFGALSAHVSGFDRGAKLGEIRLLSSSLTPSAHRPVYVAVFRDWEEGANSGEWKLIAPFGPYGEPATRTELGFSGRQGALQVLCLWNTHSVPAEILDRSWLVDSLTSDELSDAWSVFRHSIAGIPLPDGLLDRVGSPIRSLQDLRHDYQYEEISHMSRVAKLAMQAASTQEGTSDQESESVVILPSICLAYEEMEALMAAASTPAVSASDEFEVEGSDLTVKFYFDGRSTTLAVFAPDGEPSNNLDGTKILGASGEELGVVLEGFASLQSSEATKGVRLLNASGEPLTLKGIS